MFYQYRDQQRARPFQAGLGSSWVGKRDRRVYGREFADRGGDRDGLLARWRRQRRLVPSASLGPDIDLCREPVPDPRADGDAVPTGRRYDRVMQLSGHPNAGSDFERPLTPRPARDTLHGGGRLDGGVFDVAQVGLHAMSADDVGSVEFGCRGSSLLRCRCRAGTVAALLAPAPGSAFARRLPSPGKRILDLLRDVERIGYGLA